MPTLLAPLLLSALVLLFGGTVYGAIRYSGDLHGRLALRVVALLISASWLASGALVAALLIRAIH
jgi:hypothetical protein